MNELTTTDRSQLVNEVRTDLKERWILNESKLLKAIDGLWVDTQAIATFYVDMMKGAVKSDLQWETIPDNDARLKAADKLLKIMTWTLWGNKWPVINFNTQNNNIWKNPPWPDDVLKY
jgi:hypothetical protein